MRALRPACGRRPTAGRAGPGRGGGTSRRLPGSSRGRLRLGAGRWTASPAGSQMVSERARRWRRRPRLGRILPISRLVNGRSGPRLHPGSFLPNSARERLAGSTASDPATASRGDEWHVGTVERPATAPAFHHARNWQGRGAAAATASRRRMSGRSTATIGVMTHRVTLIPGDGIGPELAEATRRVLEASGVAFDVGRRGRRRSRHGRVRHAAPGARPGLDPPQPGRPQGPDHDPDRRGLPVASTSRCARRSGSTRTSARPGP